MFRLRAKVMLHKKKMEEAKVVPKQGDTVVTLKCEEDLPLEERVELLAYAFAKLVQGSILRTVLDWNISDGCIRFVIGHVNVAKPARGKVSARLEEASKVEGLVVETERFAGGEYAR